MVRSRVQAVRERIAAAARRAGRSPDEVTLIAVSKTHTPAEVTEAINAGVGHLGENRVQEAAVKIPHSPPATWHLIGPLQRNKAKLALDLFDVVQTIDRPQLVRRLEQLLVSHWPDRLLPVLIEVNLGDEASKAGVRIPDLASLAEEVAASPHLRCDGLMAIPPFGQAREVTREYFRSLRKLKDKLEQQLGSALPHLSMGMSDDYEVAIEEGATMVRVGTAIFGARGTPYKG